MVVFNDRFFKKVFLPIIGVNLVLILFFPFYGKAENSQPRFTCSLNWNQFVEILETEKKMSASNFALSLGFSSPQTLDLFFSLGLEELDYSDENGEKFYFEPALSFQFGSSVYILKNLRVGIPADFSISLDYIRAIHDEKNKTNRKYTHERISCTGDFYWHYSQVMPYMKFGLAKAELNTPERNVKENPSLLFIMGIKFPLVQSLFGKMEFNIYKDLGFCLGLENYF